MDERQPSSLLPENTSNLDAAAHQELSALGDFDIVIGIPTHRNGRTIAEVLRAINLGLIDAFPSQRILLINADGGSSDNTTHLVAEASMPANVAKIITAYQGPTGRGSAVRAIYEAAALTQARACLVLDARIPGIRPDWLAKLIQPVLEGYDLAIGAYELSPYAAAFTDNVVYPFLRAFLNTDLRNPLPCELCVAGSCINDLLDEDVWETDVARFGLNIWVTLGALLAHRRMVQVELGYRGDPSGDPGAMADPRLLHVLSTLFRFLTIHNRLWITPQPVLHVPVIAANQQPADLACPDCIPQLITAMRDGMHIYHREWTQILSKKDLATIQQLSEAAPEAFRFPLDLWTRVLLRFAFVYNCGEGDPDKVAEAFLPLFYGRAAAYIRDTLAFALTEREHQVEQIVKAMADAKPAFVAIWQDRPFWMDPAWF